LRSQAISVNSGVSHKTQSVRLGNADANPAGEIILSFSRTRAFQFFSQEKILSAMKNKIHFFLVDSESDF